MLNFLKKVWAADGPLFSKVAANPKTWLAVVSLVGIVAGHSLPDSTAAQIATVIASLFS